MVLDRPEHKIGHIRARDCATGMRQVTLPHAIVPRIGLVCESRWADYGPVEFGLSKDSLHFRCIGNDSRKKQPADEVCRGYKGIPEQERYRLDNHAADSG